MPYSPPAMRLAVLFDLDGTLVARDAAAERWLRAALARSGTVDEARVARLLALDGHGYADRNLFAQALYEALPGLEPTPHAVLERFRAEMARDTRAVPGAHELLQELEREARVAILTNGSTRTQRAKIAAAGFASWPSFVSEELGVDKPDPQAFFAVCAALEVPPERCLYVGDDPERDVLGARAAGLDACWVRDGRRWEHELPAPSFAVEQVTQLRATALLDRLRVRCAT